MPKTTAPSGLITALRVLKSYFQWFILSKETQQAGTPDDTQNVLESLPSKIKALIEREVAGCAQYFTEGKTVQHAYQAIIEKLKKAYIFEAKDTHLLTLEDSAASEERSFDSPHSLVSDPENEDSGVSQEQNFAKIYLAALAAHRSHLTGDEKQKLNFLAAIAQGVFGIEKQEFEAYRLQRVEDSSHWLLEAKQKVCDEKQAVKLYEKRGYKYLYALAVLEKNKGNTQAIKEKLECAYRMGIVSKQAVSLALEVYSEPHSSNKEKIKLEVIPRSDSSLSLSHIKQTLLGDKEAQSVTDGEYRYSYQGKEGLFAAAENRYVALKVSKGNAISLPLKAHEGGKISCELKSQDLSLEAARLMVATFKRLHSNEKVFNLAASTTRFTQQALVHFQQAAKESNLKIDWTASQKSRLEAKYDCQVDAKAPQQSSPASALVISAGHNGGGEPESSRLRSCTI